MELFFQQVCCHVKYRHALFVCTRCFVQRDAVHEGEIAVCWEQVQLSPKAVQRAAALAGQRKLLRNAEVEKSQMLSDPGLKVLA